ncbi:hypothetical protein [Paraburkholderia bannensis]|uniref:hypothetical protein n=1 Tax=Paraburkholderia TaxID=1822464 RepID=UPI003906C016
MVVSGSSPQLKADSPFKGLQMQLKGTGNRIVVARGFQLPPNFSGDVLTSRDDACNRASSDRCPRLHRLSHRHMLAETWRHNGADRIEYREGAIYATNRTTWQASATVCSAIAPPLRLLRRRAFSRERHFDLSHWRRHLDPHQHR